MVVQKQPSHSNSSLGVERQPSQTTVSSTSSRISSTLSGSALDISLPSRRRQKASLLSRCLRIPSCICFAASNALTLAVFVVQMGAMDYVLIKHEIPETYLFICLEVPLALHMIANRVSRQALRSSSLQWIVYSWLFSAKILVLYYHVLPNLKQDYGMRSIVSLMCLTPLFYMLLTFRALRQLFHKADSAAVTSGGEGSAGKSRGRRKREHVTLDVVLLLDMLWHVVIDMTDMLTITFWAQPSDERDGLGSALVDKFPDEIAAISACAGAFVFLGFLFHQQSFPSIGIANNTASSEPRTSIDVANGSSSTSLAVKTVESVRSLRLNRLWQGANDSFTDQSQVAENGSIDVVKARKRSAMVSIMLIDLPFFVLRTYIYSLTLTLQGGATLSQVDVVNPLVNLTTTNATSLIDVAFGIGDLAFGSTKIETTRKPQLDKWWIKNALCLVLQATQLRFVQQADVEQSQNLQWRDVHHAAEYKRMRRRKKMPQDAHLKKAWEEADSKLHKQDYVQGAVALATQVSPSRIGVLQAEMGDTPAFGAKPASPSGALSPSSMEAGGHSSTPQVGGRKPSAEKKELPQKVVFWSRCRGRCSNCVRAVLQSGRRCCYPSEVLLHALIGLVLGWLVAKHDFLQAHAMLLRSLGRA